jgi:ribosomal protein L29
MDFQDLKNQSEKELHDLLAEKREELRELKFKVQENQLKNVRNIRKVRKVVAQILTLLNTKKENSSAPLSSDKVAKGEETK